MKVITWNINFKTDKSKLWDYIDKEINPDILLLQECRNFPSIYQGIGERIGGTRSWGSVVLSKKYTLEPIYLPNHVGWVAGARIEVNDLKLLVFSIHAKLKDIGRYVVPHLKNIFNDIMESAGDTQYIIIGGDFNAARLYDSIYFQPVEASHNKFFDWLETDLNFISAHARFNEKEVQTMRGNAKHPYQNDHIYVSKSMSELLTNSQVLADDVISNLSDHNPVAAEFNLKD
jgi:endonuclease/exonuclease/phosphatase family metal-dependent hydrolase